MHNLADRSSYLFPHERLESRNVFFVALIEDPLFDLLPSQKPGTGQDAQVLRRRGLRDIQFFRDQQTADAVFDQIAVRLRPKVGGGIFQPPENL